MYAFDIDHGHAPFFLSVTMPLLVSTKIVSRQDLSTKLLRDWRIVSISDEIAVHLDVLGLFNGIKDHRFDEHEPLTLTKDLPLTAQIANAQNAKFFQDLPLFATVADVVSAFGLYIKFALLEASTPSTESQLQPEKPQLNAFQVSSSLNEY